MSNHEQEYKDLGFEYVSYEREPGFNQGYYLGSKNEALQHKWWAIFGVALGTIVSNAVWLLSL